MTMAIQAFVVANYPRKWKVGNLRLNLFLKLCLYRDNRFLDRPNKFDGNGAFDEWGGGGGGGGQFFLLW